MKNVLKALRAVPAETIRRRTFAYAGATPFSVVRHSAFSLSAFSLLYS
jgi:hypothetical protein